MIEFFTKLQTAFSSLKVYIASLTGIIALYKIFIAAFVSGQDRRETLSQILGLVIFTCLIMYSDRFFNWIATIMG